MHQDNVLVATGVTYYHQNDETTFFEWLGRMECVQSFRGELRDLLITLKRRPTQHDLQELLAFFFRYDIDMSQLIRFETKTNSKWLRHPEAYWHERMFDDGD